jgi:phosphatidylethanolamine-binding protein (PEBP) family uncharacterized protein
MIGKSRTTTTFVVHPKLKYLIDLDVPASFSNPSAGPRRTNLHALITGFKATGQKIGTVNTLSSAATGPVKYVGPGPPKETPEHPHRYVNLLFETNSTFSVPQSYVQQTLGFDLPAFVQKTGLGAPVAGNWFNVTG